MPLKYHEAIKGPLLKMLFVVVDTREDFKTNFSTSASDGEVMFNRFSKPNEVSNVVRAILQLIDSSAIGAAVESRKRIIEETDPGHIYVENVRQFFGLPTSVAKGLCELAVREGLFIRCEGIRCPNDDRFIEEICNDEKPPESLDCDVCEDLGLRADFAISECKRLTFYRVNHKEDY